MKTKTIEKMAAKDASDWAFAEMFFGEGSGIRRRHLSAQISEKCADLDGYESAFAKFYNAQNMTEQAEKALKHRKQIDRAAKVNKNVNALLTGKVHKLSNGLLVVGVAGYALHVTGYDKVIVEESKVQWIRLKMAVHLHREYDQETARRLYREFVADTR